MLRRHRRRDDAQASSQHLARADDPAANGVQNTGLAGHGGMTSSSSTMSNMYAGSGSGNGGNGLGTGAHPIYMQGAGRNSSSSSIQRSSGRVYDARRQQMPQQPLISPPSLSGNNSQSQQQQRSNYESMKYGPPPATRHRHLPSSTSTDAFGSSPSSAAPASPQKQQLHMAAGHTSGASAPVAQMGRSQSTLNFLLSKAKNPFSSSSSTSQQASSSSQHMPTSSIGTSASMSSFVGSPEDGRSDNTTARNRTTSGASSQYMASNAPADHNDGQMLGRSFGDETMGPSNSSPIKQRGLFGRDRKASTTSMNRSIDRNTGPVGQSGSSRSGLSSYAPLLRKGARYDSGASNNSFSKSQSDLHARSDYSSPQLGTLDLPRVVEDKERSGRGSNDFRSALGAGSGSGRTSNDSAMLQAAPVSSAAFSRSVDDLSRSHTPELSFTSGRQKMAWGDNGVALGEFPGRKRDAAGGASSSRRSEKPTTSTLLHLGSTASFQSLAAIGSGRSTNSPSGSEAPSNSKTSRQAPNKTQSRLATGEDASRSMPPGVTYEAFLNRNVNVSLSIAQLNENRREKDIGKGWKPFKAVLRDGKLYFYKVPNSAAEEVKNLFPSSVVPESAACAGFGDQGISAEDIKRNRLNTRDLLNATTDGAYAPKSPAERIKMQQSTLSTDLGSGAKSQKWQQGGHHQDLELSPALDEPPSWTARIRGGSLEALAHEYVFATQANGRPSAEEAKTFFCALVSMHIFREQRPLQSLLISLHKWGISATASQSPGVGAEEVGNSKGQKGQDKSGFQVGLAARMALAADARLLALAPEDAKESVLILLQDIARDCTSALVSEYDVETVAASITALSHSSPPTFDPAMAQFSATYLLSCEPSSIAKQIHAFQVKKCSTLFESSSLSALSLAAQFANAGNADLVSFDWNRPHFLTRLIWDHVLTRQQVGESASSSTQDAKERASYLRHWIAIASYLLKLKNVAAWLAICVALCSRAVARLSMTWRFVAVSDRELVSTCWAPIVASLGWSEIEAPDVAAYTDDASKIKSSINATTSGSTHDSLPYLGNALLTLYEVKSLEAGAPGFYPLAAAESAALRLGALDEHLKELKVPLNLRQVQNVDENIQQTFGALLQSSRKEQTTSASYLALSMQLEAPTLDRSGRIGSTDYPRQIAPAAMSPLVFEEPLPNLALVQADAVSSIIDPHARALGVPQGVGDPAALRKDESGLSQRSAMRQQSPGYIPLHSLKRLSASIPTRSVKNMPFGDIPEWSTNNPNMEGTQTGKTLRFSEDLVFTLASDAASSTPSSPMVNKRFSQSVAGAAASRPSSLASKRSSLPASERSSLIEPPAAPLEVSLKAASLEKLLDVLVMGVSHLTSDFVNDEAAERLGALGPRRQRLSIDIATHRKIFLATYRTQCSSAVLFDHLRKRLFAALDAGREMSLPAQHRPLYPSWPRVEPAGSSSAQIDWDTVSRVRKGVIAFYSMWISRHSYDFIEEEELYAGVHKLAEELENTRMRNIDDMDFEKTLRGLDDLTRQLRLAVMSAQSEHRVSKRSSKRTSANAVIEPRTGSPTIDIDAANAAEVVDYLESVVRVFFDKIDEIDLLQTYEMFDKHANDPAAWHVARYSEAASQSHAEDVPAVNSMYKLLEFLRWPPESRTLIQSLPGPVRDACAAQNLLRGWTAIQIIQDDIGLERRSARIGKLIDALWVCRARMCHSRIEDFATSPISPAFIFQEPTIASFVESVIVGSLTSSESRLFSHAWHVTALERNTTTESLMGFAPTREACEAYREAIQRSSTPDVGWLLKCIAQAVSRVPEYGRGDSLLLDFEKCRTVSSIIQSSVGRTTSGSLDPTLVDLAGARLGAMQNALRSVAWDRRIFKDNNAREANSGYYIRDGNAGGSRRVPRPLLGVTYLQQEKTRRDRAAFDLIASHLHRARGLSLAAQLEADQVRRLPSPTPASPSLLPSVVSGNEKKTRRMTALFRGAVRPMGLMTSSHDRFSPEVALHTTDELMSMVPTSKAAFATTCGSCRISHWPNSQRSFVFNMSPPEGGHILLQAANSRELYDWLRVIESTSKEYNRSQPLAGVFGSGDASRKAANGARGGRNAFLPLYGTDIEKLAEHEKRSIPTGVERMLQQVEARGLREQGIYRISGAKSAIEALKIAFSTTPAESVNLTTGDLSDVHTIAGAIKQWFRDLPDPVIPYSAYHAIIAAERMENEEERLYAIRDIIWEFSKPHFDLLKRICEHLALVCSEGEHNLMAPHNIGLVFGTSLLNPPPSPAAVAESFGNIGKAAHVVKILVTMHEWLFESEQEAEKQTVERSEGAQSTDVLAAPTSSIVPQTPELTPGTEDAQDISSPEMREPPVVVDPAQRGYPDFLGQHRNESTDSGMMRAVLSAQGSASPDTKAHSMNLDPADEAAIKKARRRESGMTGVPLTPSPILPGETITSGIPAPRAFAEVAEEEEEEEDEGGDEEEEGKSPAAGGIDRTITLKSSPGASALADPANRASAKTRRSRTESVYLDAREAIAALQNTFDAGDDEGDDAGVRHNNGNTVSAAAVSDQDLPLTPINETFTPEIRRDSPPLSQE